MLLFSLIAKIHNFHSEPQDFLFYSINKVIQSHGPLLGIVVLFMLYECVHNAVYKSGDVD